ncbi:long-chain acyl-CoA synthetase [Marininema mesophilum]|uniref:Long-chain acyl-CoA synthetase n=1 Tax=Marininema mesophilum TaxID=1048340 RepID=A0A1H2SGI5_9BACL|nr:long-chain fatty acid--CoA ligase [Marininema mesophilum]SDW30647.1 long-chain acyl-CoA synthetase [Marininema mesophilum]
MKSRNLVEMVKKTVEACPDKTALMWKNEGAYKNLSYREFWEQIRDAAAGLARLGVKDGDKVAILSENNPMWTVSDLAIASLGGVSVPIYPTLPADQVAYMLQNADCVAAIVENEAQFAKVKEGNANLSHIIVMKPEPGLSRGEGVLSFRDLLQEGAALPIIAWEEGWMKIHRDQLVTIIHTSGTTGKPKGVMLTHGNFLSNIEGVLFWVVDLRREDVSLSYLPLSHVFERMVGQYAPLYVGSTVAFAEGIDKISENLLEVRPTMMTSVPRLFEKVSVAVLEQIKQATPIRRKIFNWAMSLGIERYNRFQASYEEDWVFRDPLTPTLRRQLRVADRLVYSKVRDRLGGRIRGMVSGGAALNADVNRFFWAMNIPIIEGYGLTETSPIITANPTMKAKVGTVGKPLPNVEVSVAPDGEVLVKGPNVMAGYYKNEEATAKAIKDGWFYTGDLGEFDEQGYLRLIDRKKSILVLSTGKNVAPQPLESEMNNSPFISQSALIGNGRKYTIALVVPDIEHIRPWAKREGIEADTFTEIINHPKVRQLIVQQVEEKTAEFASFERPKKTAIVDREWTVDGGELTPTLKVKMKVIEERYRELIQSMYDGTMPTEEVAVGEA